MTQAQHEKYDTKTPSAIKMSQGFMHSIDDLVSQIKGPIQTITECGCGQGHVNQRLEQLFPDAQIKGFDINPKEVAIAEQNKHHESTQLYVKSIYDIGHQEQADLVVCCEVLEHLDEPGLALQKMRELQAKYYLFSVPNEPLWRILNFMRGKYMRDWGNTPDHCNHWSTRGFKSFVNQQLSVQHVNRPIPWTMVLATHQ